MCGILFYYGKNGIPQKVFKEALDLQSHRGPDHTGIYYNKKNIDNLNDLIFTSINLSKNKKIENTVSNFFIGHKRLSVFDLSEKSNQPFISQDSKNFFIYNGEFYNFKDYAKKEFENSDGLTLYDGVLNKGIDFYNNVNGMWASVHSDIKNKRIYLSRDRYGKKPLYYYLDKNNFIVSSEIKSIFHILGSKRKINLKSLAYFFSFKMSPFFNNGETFYENIYSIPPGEIFYFDLLTNKMNFHSKIFHMNNETDINFLNNEKEIEEAFTDDFQSAVNLRLKTDRKVAILLSGGIDSSLISAFIEKKDLSNFNFYTVFDPSNSNNNSDLYYSKKIAEILGIKTNEISMGFDYKKFDSILNTLSKQQEVPVNFFATAFPTFYISQQMKLDNIHVALDGVGGDEIMGGFPSYTSLAIASLRSNKFFKAILYYFEFIKYEDINIYNKLKFLIYIFLKGSINKKSLLSFQKNALGTLKYIKNPILKNYITDLTLDYKREKLFDQTSRQIFEVENGGIPYYLGVSDSSNMINTVESRSPFLDTRINKYIYMPDNLKFRNGYNKYLSRKVLSNKFPKEISWRKQKKGFTTHGSELFLKDKRSIEKILDSKIIKEITNKNINLELINKNKYVARHLLSLAALDNIYDLSI